MKYAAPWFSHDSRPVAQHRWRGMRGWVQWTQGLASITLASQCNYAAFQDVSANPEPGFLIQPLLLRTVRSCGGNHFHYTQKGAHDFRFALQVQADPSRLGEELDSPLLAYVPTTNSTVSGILPERLSFLGLNVPNVHVAVVKQAEDGQGLIVRLVEMKERKRTTAAELKAFRPIKEVRRTSILEQNHEALGPHGNAVNLSLDPAGIETLRIVF